MKRALTSIALLLLALPALADINVRERDVLLTGDGVVYTVEAVHDSDVAEGRSSRYLRMFIQQGNERTSAEIPAAQYGGLHGQPALAYDSLSETLFVFWQAAYHRYGNWHAVGGSGALALSTTRVGSNADIQITGGSTSTPRSRPAASSCTSCTPSARACSA